MLCEWVQSCFGVGTRGQKIKVPNRLLTAAQTARRSHRLDPWDRLQECHQLVGHPVGKAQQEPAGSLPVGRDRTEHFLLKLGPHTRQLAQLLLLADLLQVVDGRSPVVLEKSSDSLRT